MQDLRSTTTPFAHEDILHAGAVACIIGVPARRVHQDLDHKAPKLFVEPRRTQSTQSTQRLNQRACFHGFELFFALIALFAVYSGLSPTGDLQPANCELSDTVNDNGSLLWI